MFSEQDKDVIFKLAELLTGSSQEGQARQEALLLNVQRRLDVLKISTLGEYLQHVENDAQEHAHLISALTIHTTSWFRENPHFVKFQEILLAALEKSEVFTVWCAGCSSGEEVYSFGLILEEFRRVHPKFDYRLLGTDIDPISVQHAERAIYSAKQINFHLGRYRNHLLLGSGKTAGFFTLAKSIRERCSFRVHDLRSPLPTNEGIFHVIVCRNVLIYFESAVSQNIVVNFLRNLSPSGRIVLGHSEHIEFKDLGLEQEGHSVYAREVPKPVEPVRKEPQKYRILSIDDSKLARKKISEAITEMGFESVTASSGSEATALLNSENFDVVTLDLNMPDVQGDKWLRGERNEGLKTPVVILSDVHPHEAPEVVKLLSMGAQEYVEKNQLTRSPGAIKNILLELITSSKRSGQSTGTNFKTQPWFRPEIIMIGSSTGGPRALSQVLSDLPPHTPPILITQHISEKFAQPLVERLCEVSGLKQGLPEDGAPLQAGHLYLALGDYHLGVSERGGELVVVRSTLQAYNGHRPSVDVMFNSVLGIKRKVMSILLTGMGRDGALGMRFLHKDGAYCVAQSEEDCLIYGMPREAIERGAVNYVGNLQEIRQILGMAIDFKKAAA